MGKELTTGTLLLMVTVVGSGNDDKNWNGSCYIDVSGIDVN